MYKCIVGYYFDCKILTMIKIVREDMEQAMRNMPIVGTGTLKQKIEVYKEILEEVMTNKSSKTVDSTN